MFYHRLALRLGRTVHELLSTISGEELTMWAAFDKLEPIGDWRMDLGFGVVASTIANFSGRMLKDGESKRAIDYMPLRPRPEEEVPLATRVRTMLRAVPTKKE